MVTIQPDGGHVFKLTVGGDIFWGKVTMVVNNRHFLRMIMIKPSGKIVFKKKIICKEIVFGKLY
jgi:hypothetical protein